jgi:hypothetical protein
MKAIGMRLAALAALAVVAAGARGDEEKLPLDKVPEKVLDAVKKKFPDAKLTGASKETEDGKPIIEVEFTWKDHKYEAELTPDGEFIAIDKQIEAKELPAAVLKTLEEKYPKAKYDIIEEVTKKDKIAEYEIELTTADKKKVEALIAPDGAFLKEEKKEGGEDKKDVKEEKIDLDKLPREVVDAVKKKFPDGKLTGAEKVTEGKKISYEVNLTNKDDKIELVVSAEGKILAMERVLPAKDLPKAIADAIEKKYPRSTIKTAEEVSKEDKVTAYEAVIVTEDKKTLEVTFDPSGKFVGEEKIEPKTEDKDKKGDKKDK